MLLDDTRCMSGLREEEHRVFLKMELAVEVTVCVNLIIGFSRLQLGLLGYRQ